MEWNYLTSSRSGSSNSHTSYLKTNKELHLDKSSYKVDFLILREDFNSKTLKSFDN